jgi:hypothetical protein
MPFQSEKQRRYLHANHPEIANRWEAKYGLGGIAELNAQLNSLPEYYLPKNQGGRIGFNQGTQLNAKQLWEKMMLENYTPTEEEKKLIQWYLSTFMNKGGRVPSHQAGIYGLNEGGRTGFFTAGLAQGDDISPGTSVSGGTRSGSDGGYQNVHQTGAVTQTPGRTTTPDLPPQLGGSSTAEDAITYARDDFETQKATLEKKIQNSLRNKFIGVLLGGPLTLGLGDLRTAKNMYDLGQVKKDYINLLENAKTLYKNQGVPEFNPHVDTAIQTINQEILDLTQTRDKPDEDRGGDGITGIASIKYENIEDINEDQARRASAEANTILEDARNAKRDAYLAAFRQKYLMGDTEEPQTMFVAQGGRIPGGYNTGGLSNLFRLKNV